MHRVLRTTPWEEYSQQKGIRFGRAARFSLLRIFTTPYPRSLLIPMWKSIRSSQYSKEKPSSSSLNPECPPGFSWTRIRESFRGRPLSSATARRFSLEFAMKWAVLPSRCRFAYLKGRKCQSGTSPTTPRRGFGMLFPCVFCYSSLFLFSLFFVALVQRRDVNWRDGIRVLSIVCSYATAEYGTADSALLFRSP